MKFILLINVKMPTIVIKTASESLKPRFFLKKSQQFCFYKWLKFHAQMNQAQKKFYNIGPDFSWMLNYLSTGFQYKKSKRTSDGGNGNHSVWLPIILIRIKVDQMLPSSYISSLLVSIL